MSRSTKSLAKYRSQSRSYREIILLTLVSWLLVSSYSIAALQPRIVGGNKSDPDDRSFMAALIFTGSESRSLRAGQTTLELNNHEYSAKSISGTPLAAFSGKLIDCGLAEAPCVGDSGSICLIQQNSDPLTEQLQNCEKSGGSAAIIFGDDADDQQYSVDENIISIPAVNIRTQDSFTFMKALGGQVSRDVRGSVGGFFCGGSLIAKDWVITAAHCLDHDEINPDSFVVSLGGEDISIRGNEVIAVKRVVIHQNFSATSLDNDIALIQLERPSKTFGCRG